MQTNLAHTPLKIEQLTHRYGDKTVLNNVSLALDHPSITALLGSNGAGKTTLINCALGLLKPSQGRIEIHGKKAGSRAAKQLTGLMLQDSNLPDQLTAREHISLFRTYYPNPLPVESVLDLCDLSGFADQRYKHLSGGQKRRVQFALAILGRPTLVFLDEPTTGLDTQARTILWNTICALRDSGTSIVLTTHYLEEADALADQVIVIGEGRIIAKGANSDIRSAVNGSMIRCTTELNPHIIKQLDDVHSVKVSGRYIEIISSNGPQTLRALLNRDKQVADISVQKPSLEDAFEQIIGNQEQQA